MTLLQNTTKCEKILKGICDLKVTSGIQFEIDIRNFINDKFFLDIKEIDKKEFIKKPSGFDWYVYQPYGSQRSPDFILCENNVMIELEIKTSKTGIIMWNSGKVCLDRFYIYGNTKKNIISPFYGGDVYGEKELEYQKKCTIECKKLAEKLNNERKGSCFSITAREMFNDYVNHTNHPNSNIIRSSFYEKLNYKINK